MTYSQKYLERRATRFVNKKRKRGNIVDVVVAYFSTMLIVSLWTIASRCPL
jgi:hypothetical protein